MTPSLVCVCVVSTTTADGRKNRKRREKQNCREFNHPTAAGVGSQIVGVAMVTNATFSIRAPERGGRLSNTEGRPDGHKRLHISRLSGFTRSH